MDKIKPKFSSVQSLSRVEVFATPWTAARQASLSFTICWCLLTLMSIESVMPSNHLTLCCSLLLPPSVFPASGSFQMSQLFTSGGWSIGVSASASVLPVNIQGWFPLGLTGLISLLSKGLSRVFSKTRILKASVLWHSAFFMVQLTFIHDYWKNHSLTRQNFVQKGCLCFLISYLGWS